MPLIGELLYTYLRHCENFDFTAFVLKTINNNGKCESKFFLPKALHMAFNLKASDAAVDSAMFACVLEKLLRLRRQ